MATHKIVASESGRPAKEKALSVDKPVKDKINQEERPKRRKNPLVLLGGYFVGAWHELREVRWPNRKATWSLTIAVIGFVMFFIILISLLDIFYKYIFELILK